NDQVAPVLVSANQFSSTSSTSSSDGFGTAVFLSDDPTPFGEVGSAPVLATIRGNTISGFLRGVDVLRNGTAVNGPQDVTVTLGGSAAGQNNTITGPGAGVAGSFGVRVLDANGSAAGNATATLTDNTIGGFATGVLVDQGRVTSMGDHIQGN